MNHKFFLLGSFLGLIASIFASYLMLLCGINPALSAVFFIIPIGGVMLGAIIGWIAKTGLLMDNQPLKTWHKAVAGILGAASVACTTYLDYATCYVTSDGVSRLFKGTHVSRALGMNLLEYFGSVYLHGSMTVRFRGATEFTLDSPTYVIIIYILEYIAAAAFAIIMLSSIKSRAMCPTCGKYYKIKDVDYFFGDKTADQIANAVLEELSQDRFYTRHYKKTAGCTYSVKVEYCKDCRNGLLKVNRIVRSRRSVQHVPIGTYKIGEAELFKFQLVD